MGDAGFENAYALLTSIQGFDSFSLGPSSSTNEIARAFQTQSLIWHPDKNPTNREDAEAKFVKVAEAYEVLSDSQERAYYDDNRDYVLEEDDEEESGLEEERRLQL